MRNIIFIFITLYFYLLVGTDIKCNTSRVEQSKSSSRTGKVFVDLGEHDQAQHTLVSKMSSQEYNVELINETDSDAVMNLLQRTFFIEEPKVKAIGLFESGSCPEMEDICRKSWLDPLSISVKAVDAEGNIVGVFISGPVNLKENSSQVLIRAAETCKNEKFKKYVHVLTKRDEELVGLVEKYPEEEQILFVKLVATDPAWRNKGIMKVLLERTEQIARQKRFRLIRMDTTNAFSASYAERNGFTCVYKVKLADIKMNGESLIVPEEPHIYDRVFIKDLLS